MVCEQNIFVSLSDYDVCVVVTCEQLKTSIIFLLDCIYVEEFLCERGIKYSVKMIV